MNDKNYFEWDYEIHSAGITQCRSDWSWDTKKQPFSDYDLWVVLQGNGQMRMDRQIFDVSEGTCMLLRPGEHYIGNQNLKNRLSVFHIHFDAVDPEGDPISLKDFFPLYRELYDFLLFRHLLFKLLDICNKGRKKEASHWMQVILDEVREQDKHNELRIAAPILIDIQKLCGQIQESPEKRFSLHELADHYGYSPDYFGRLFKRVAGRSFSDYIVAVRINQARVYLRNTDSSIESIASQLGYEDTGFFCRQFKQRMGCSPGQYRKGKQI